MKAYQNLQVTGSIAVSGTVHAVYVYSTASFSNTASYIAPGATASYALTASYLSGSSATVQNLIVAGTASIKYLNVAFESSSVIFSSGSNQFGDAQDDNHIFTGSVGITGSLTMNSASVATLGNITGSLTGKFSGSAVGTFTGSFTGSASGSLTGSFDGKGTGSFDGLLTGSGLFYNLRVTGSQQVTGTFGLTGSQQVSGTIYLNNVDTGSNVFGTSSWAMNVVGGASSAAATVVSASAPPTTSIQGALWFDTVSGNLYVQASSPTGSSWTPTSLIMVTGSVTASIHQTKGFTVSSLLSGSTFTGSVIITSGTIKVGSQPSSVTYPSASVIVSNVPFIADVEPHNIGVLGAGMASNTGWGVGVYGKGWTAADTRSAGIIGEGMVSASTDAGSSVGVRGYALQAHTGGLNIGLLGEAASGSSNYALYMTNGNIFSNYPQTWTLPSSASALNIGNGLLNLNTTASIVTITGSLIVSSSTTGSNIFGTASWATKVESATVISASAPPTTSASGSLWWNTNDGNLYVQVNSPTGSGWVPATTTVANGQYGATVTTAQATAATTWTVNHNLNTLTPIVQVYTGSQVLIPASITSTDANTTTITFATATAGTSVISTGVGGPTSSSFALTAATSSYAQTASYVPYVYSASYATDGSTISSTTFADLPGAILTLPSAGIYRVSYNISTSGPLDGSTTLFTITDSSNNSYSGSYGYGVKVYGSIWASAATQEITINVNTPTTIKMRWRVNGSGTTTLVSSTNGSSVFRYEKKQ